MNENKGGSILLLVAIYGDKTYYVKSNSKCNNKYKQDEIIQSERFFFIDNTIVQSGGLVFQQTIGILMGTIVLHYLPICFYTLPSSACRDRKLD